MADSSQVAGATKARPSAAVKRGDLERVQEFTREPILLEGEGLDELVPGSARRLALDAALDEIAAGRENPSIEWRRDYSLLLGLERLLDEEAPHLADGAELSAHQVDALSGTLAALTTEVEDPGANGRFNGRWGAGGDTAS
jgi:ribonuclease E